MQVPSAAAYHPLSHIVQVVVAVVESQVHVSQCDAHAEGKKQTHTYTHSSVNQTITAAAARLAVDGT